MAVFKGVTQTDLENGRIAPLGRDLSKITYRAERFEFQKGVDDDGNKYGNVALKADDTFESDILMIPANSALQFVTLIKAGESGYRTIIQYRERAASGMAGNEWGSWKDLQEESAPGLTRFDVNQNKPIFFKSDNMDRQFRINMKAAVSENAATTDEAGVFILYLQFGNL